MKTLSLPTAGKLYPFTSYLFTFYFFLLPFSFYLFPCPHTFGIYAECMRSVCRMYEECMSYVWESPIKALSKPTHMYVTCMNP